MNYKDRKKYERLKKSQRYANSSTCITNYRPAHFQLDRICANSGISSRARNAAFKLYIEAQKKGLIRMVIVCLYHVCRQFEYFRLLSDFVPEVEGLLDIENPTKAEVLLHKCYRVLVIDSVLI